MRTSHTFLLHAGEDNPHVREETAEVGRMMGAIAIVSASITVAETGLIEIVSAVAAEEAAAAEAVAAEAAVASLGSTETTGLLRGQEDREAAAGTTNVRVETITLSVDHC